MKCPMHLQHSCNFCTQSSAYVTHMFVLITAVKIYFLNISSSNQDKLVSPVVLRPQLVPNLLSIAPTFRLIPHNRIVFFQIHGIHTPPALPTPMPNLSHRNDYVN